MNNSNNQFIKVWELPCLSQEIDAMLSQIERGPKVSITFEYEGEEGMMNGSLNFYDVDAITYTFYKCCSVEQIKAYDTLVIVQPSSWLADLQSIKTNGNANSNMKHYRIFLDEDGCYEVIASHFDTTVMRQSEF